MSDNKEAVVEALETTSTQSKVISTSSMTTVTQTMQESLF